MCASNYCRMEPTPIPRAVVPQMLGPLFPTAVKGENVSKCFYCGADTRLFDNDVPICIKCAEKVDAKRKENEKEESKKLQPGRRLGTYD